MNDINNFKNRIILGDTYKIIKEIPDKSIDLIYTDIPYLITHGGSGSSPLSQRIHREFSKDLKDLKGGIDYTLLDEFCRVLKKINCFIWCSKLQIIDILNYFNNKKVNFEILVWGKTNPTPATNNVWLPDIEYCLYFREKGVKLNNGYDLKHKYYVSGINVKDKRKYNHPTIKPLELVEKHILHTTQENDIVFDPFVGSGTTCVAAKECNRQFIGIELVEDYYNTAVERINEAQQMALLN